MLSLQILKIRFIIISKIFAINTNLKLLNYKLKIKKVCFKLANQRDELK